MDVEYEITKKQAKFLQSEKRIVLFKGGIRSGKTYVLCIKAILTALAKERFAIVSFSYPMLRDVVLYTMDDVLSTMKIPYKINSSSMIVDVMGQDILLRSGDNPDKLRGLSLHKFGIDEAREFTTRYIFDLMIGRCSKSKTPQAYLATTTKGRNWVYELEKDEQCDVITQSIYDNPFLSREFINFIESQYTTSFAAQELEAKIIDMGAGVLDSNWFKMVDYVPPPVEGAVRFWDLAVTIKTSSDYASGALCSFQDNKLIIHNIFRGKLKYPDLRRKIKELAIDDGNDVTICIEEAGQQKGFIDDIRTIPELMNHSIRAMKPKGDKFNRCMPWASQAELGNVYLCRGKWNQDFKDECDSFTQDDSHEHDDQVDSISGAYQYLAMHAGFRIYTPGDETNDLEKDK